VPGWAPGTSAAILEVADTGPGIPAEHAERVFERLYRVDLSRSRHDGGGSGLGLSIVTAIVDAHGGRVELETAPGRGCVFRVLLPEAPPR
jgi:two-component system OmpR family sensor kinase